MTAWDRYCRYYVPRFRPLFEMMTKGVRFDRVAAAAQLKALGETMARLRQAIDAVTAPDCVFGDSGGIGSQRLARHLYETLKLPKQFTVDKKTKKKSVTTREVALRSLATKYPTKSEAIRLVLEYRKAQKLQQYFADGLADDDGYIRCSYRFTTEAMRLSSSKNPRRTGTNQQNQPKAARVVYLPDPGHVWLKLDLSQVESRIVYVLSKDKALIEQARALPWEFDVHSFNASIIFGEPITKAQKEKRDIGKMTVHGVQRGMTGKTLADHLMKRGIVRTPAQCQAYIDRYLRLTPGLEKGYFPSVRREMLRDRKLTNSWGDVWPIPFERFDDDLFRRGYSFKPQSNNARLIDLCGMVPLGHYIRCAGLDARLLVQVHDELGYSVAPDAAWTLYQTARQSLERPIDYEGVALSVPVEPAVGLSWGATIAFERPPTRDDFMDVITTLVKQAA